MVPPDPPHPHKQCTLKRDHASHNWWSRKWHCYYRCAGRHTSQSTVISVNQPSA